MVIATLGASLATSLAKPFLPKDTAIINRIGNTIGAEKNLYQNLFKRYLFIQANKTISKKTDHIIFQCEYMSIDYINETGIKPKKYTTIYNPVDVEKIQKKAEANIERNYDFIAVGRLMAQKDYLTMIRGFAELIKTEPTMHLGILGKGNLKEELLKEIYELGVEKNISLLGYVANPYPYIKRARFLVSSSLYEGFSNVIIEALCLGTPVVATDCPGGNPETIVPHKNGLLFKVGDSLALTNALRTSLKNEPKYNKSRIAGDAIKNYNQKEIVEQYNKIIDHYTN